MNVETSLGNQSPPKHVIQCKECGNTLKNVFSRTWQEKYKNTISQLNIIFHLFAPPTLFGT